MINLTNRDKQILKNLGVDALILFGSHAQGIATNTSDYDFLVLGGKKPGSYDRLYDLLSEKIHLLTDIDIVFEADAPLELKNHVVKYGQVLYQKTPSTFADLKQKVMLEYADFAPHRAVFNQATLARINYD